MSATPSLRQMELASPPAAWEALGFATFEGVCRLGDVDLVLREGGGGIQGWTLSGAGGSAEVDGLPTTWSPGPPGPAAAAHPNGALRLDHVVVVTDDLERTTRALGELGLEVRRVRDAGAGRRQAFLWLGARQLLVEVVGAPGAPPGVAAFWGLTVVVADLDAAAARLGDSLGAVHAAVQSGRRIATVDGRAGLGVRVALMTPHGEGA